MRKFLILVLILLCCGSAWAQINVFFLPESGFLRVEGQVTMEPTNTPLSFIVFPNAQITEFWCNGLQEYTIERGLQNTAINFSVSNLIQQQTLTFSYEGFLNLVNTEMVLDRDSLWFPEFSFPIEIPIITLRLPENWQIQTPSELKSTKKDSFIITEWQPLANTYPSFQANYAILPLQDAANSAEIPEDFTVKPKNKVELVEESQPKQEIIPVTEEFLSKIQIQVTRLTNYISSRNEDGIKALLSTPLQQAELSKYLSRPPANYGKISSEFITKPSFAQDAFQVLFSTEKGPRFQASMSWQENEGRLELHSFTLTPYELSVPKELRQSLSSFVQRLQSHAQDANQAKIKPLLSSNLPKDKVSEFLFSLNPNTLWSLQYVALEPLSITIYVDHSRQTQLLLNIGLVPGDEDWLVNTLEVVPLN